VRPNPSRGIVEIEFVLPADNKATIDIFDLAGRRVRRLWDGQARSGSNTVRWDRRDATGIAVRPGLYFVHMNIANGSIMRPVAITD
jgi:flagellar hook assembly protein FlgD